MTSNKFDLAKGQRLRDEGIKVAAENRKETLALARKIALDLARAHGTVNADMVGRVLLEQHGIESLGQATGALFKTRDFLFTGEWTPSKRISNHSRWIRVWRLAHE